MPERPYRRDVTGQVLRSITPLTGALAAGLSVFVAILAAVFYEMKFGRPSSTSALAIPFSIIWGGLAAGVGAAVGAGVREIVARSRWAGPTDRRAAALLVMVVVTIPTLAGIQAVRRMEARNAPGVIRSTGEISRAEGISELTPVQSATFLWVRFPHPDYRRSELRWNRRRVDIRVVDDQLLLRADEVSVAAIDIRRFDYAVEIYGVTAALAEEGREWLALLVQLRATGRRDLLLILDPNGVLVHEELLERPRGRVPRVGLGTAGPDSGLQEIVLDRGESIRYYVGAR